MEYAKLKSGVQEIAGIAASVPEPFQQRCFELLLSALLDETRPRDSEKDDGGNQERERQDDQKKDRTGSSESVPLNATTRAWMSRTGVTMTHLQSVLFVEDGQVHFIQEPTPNTNADGQIEWALLLALRNGLLNNSLSVDAEAVRSMVQEKGFYDKGNFSAIFRRKAALFRSAPEPQGEAQPLSVEGQQELGKLVKRLVEPKS